MKILRLDKKHVIFTPVCFSSLFQEKMWLIKESWVGRKESCNKKGVGGIYKMGWYGFLRFGTAPTPTPAIRLDRVIDNIFE